MTEDGEVGDGYYSREDHLSAQVIKRYSHIRRLELNPAAAAMEPKFLKNVLAI